ncbi:MAG TPA: hypothetical protein PLI53_12060 [Geobacteraceae bacterium]|nr:hypothetical protein [Geobacteraceae bacterium]
MWNYAGPHLLGGYAPCRRHGTVVTRENAIRQDCRFFSPVKQKVKYNDLLGILSRSGDWRKVSFHGVIGCIHKSALTEGSISLVGGLGGWGGGASADEVSLAGKGFNPQVEASYKKNHAGLNYTAVDSIERYTVSDEAQQEFMKKGGLTAP